MTPDDDVTSDVDDILHRRIFAARKTGCELFISAGEPVGPTLADFWGWSRSDLIDNLTRGVLAEFIVATALGIDTKHEVRDSWAAWDLTTPAGVKVEVKSAAYVQSWTQSALSTIVFRTPKTLAYDYDTNQQATESKRQAQVYVFALLCRKDPVTVDPLDLDQWCFYVVPTTDLDRRTRSQDSITLVSLKALIGPKSLKTVTDPKRSGPIVFCELRDAVRDAALYDVDRYGEALKFAETLHAFQERKGTPIPYISHLLAVSSLVWEGGGDEDQAIAGLLHDAVEDQGGKPVAEEIKRRFGERVAAIVEVCTDTDVSPKPAWRERKEAHLDHLETAREDALIVVAADKLHNAMATLADLRSPGGLDWSRFNVGPDQTLWFYDSMLDLLQRRIGTCPLVGRLERTVTDLHTAVSATDQSVP